MVGLTIAFWVELCASGTSNASSLASNFSTDLEGWSGSGGSVAYVATGGNLGGFLQQTDTAGDWMKIFAPTKFSGNLSSFLGGIISFDAKNINGMSTNLYETPLFGTMTLTGKTGSASRTLDGAGSGNPPSDGAWHTFSTTLDPTLWSGDLEDALHDLTQLSIVLEFHSPIEEIAGFDNFAISPSSSAVPVPSTLLLMATGLIGVAGARRKKK